jgi:aryl-alcohol dehydrogenase-like predicted oxidoreductase
MAEASLRLRTDVIDLFYQHRIDSNVPMEARKGREVESIVDEGPEAEVLPIVSSWELGSFHGVREARDFSRGKSIPRRRSMAPPTCGRHSHALLRRP